MSKVDETTQQYTTVVASYRQNNEQYLAQLEAARQLPHPAVQYETLRSAALNWRVLVDILRRNGGWEVPEGMTGNQLAEHILSVRGPMTSQLPPELAAIFSEG